MKNIHSFFYSFLFQKTGILRSSQIIASIAILITFHASFVHASLDTAEIEPNDQLGQATSIQPTGTLTSTIDPINDTDWFQITVDEPGRLVASIPSPPENMRAQMAYYDRHASYMWIYKTAINSGDSLNLTLDVTEPGTYFLNVNNANGQITAPYSLQMNFSATPDENEPNNRIGQATLITGTTMSGRIYSVSDEDWFFIYATKDEFLNFELNTPVEMQGQIDLYNQDYGYLWSYSTAANPGDTTLLTYQATETGLVYVRIKDSLNGSHLMAYTLDVTGGSPGFVPAQTPITTEVEENDSIGTANLINLSSSVTGTIADSNDPDWFSFLPTQTGQVTIVMDDSPANLTLEMVLYNDSGSHILSSRAGGPGGLFSMTFDISSLDRHYLRIRDLDNNTSLNSYQFTSSIVPVNDPFEPNDDYGDRSVLSSINQIQGNFFPSYDQDWYELHVTTPGTLRAKLSNLPENITPRIDLYNLSRNHLNSIRGTSGTDLELTYTILTEGIYLLAVSDAQNNESTEPYTLTIFGADFTQFAPVATIESIAPGAIVAGNSVTMTGSGTDSDGSVAGYEWSSSIDGILSTQATFSNNTLSIGTHTIAFRVQDNNGIWSTKTEELLYVGSSVSEEAEPNGSFFPANEIALNQPVTAKIDEVNDADYFKFYVPGPGRIVAELSIVPANLRMRVDFYDYAWDYLWVYGSAATAGDNVPVTYDVTEAGFLYIKVSDIIGQANADFTYTLTVHYAAVSDLYEPNNTLNEAAVLSTTSVNGFLFPSGDYDWYKVWVPEGAALGAEIVSVPSNVRAAIDLYGPDRQYLWRYETAVNAGDSVSATTETATDSAYYYIRVHTAEGINWEDSYTLNITGATPSFTPDMTPLSQEGEENDTISKENPIAIGTTVSGTLQPAADADWFQFTLTEPGILHIHVDELSDSIRAQIGVYQEDTSHIASRTASNPGDALAMDLRFSEPGTYHLKLNTADSGQTSSEAYALTLSFTEVSDPNEPNNHQQEATVLSNQNRAQGYIFNVGDADCYRVHSEIGNTLRISLGDVPAEIRPQIHLYDHNESLLGYKLASNDGQEITLTYTVPETADYSILIRDIGNDSFSIDPYILVIDGATFDSYVPLATIDSVLPNPADSEETVTFQGHGDDVDGSIIGYEWSSSIDGIFSISQIAETAALSSGEHTISFRVKDDNGNWSPSVSSLLYFGVPAPAESEPNNVAGSATLMDLGKQYTGTMNGTSDKDWFRVHITQAGRLTINGSTPVGSAIRLQCETYTSDLDYTWKYVTASNDGDPISLTWDIDQPGDYYFYIKDYSSRDGGEYTVSANLQAVPDPFEPNSDITQSTPISPDDQIDAYAFPQSEYDWYSVTLPTPGSLDMAITSVPSDLKMGIDVYGKNLEYTWVYKTANNAGDEVYLTYDAVEAGTYFLRVRSSDGTANTTDSYTLTTQFVQAPDAFESNADAGSAAWITESPITAFIFPRGDYDWYRVYAEPGSSLEFSVSQVPENLRLELTLYGAEQDYLWKYSDAANAGDSVTLSYANASGVYYLRVHDLDGNRAAGQTYQLAVSGANLDYRPPTTPSTTEAEPNDAYSAATFVGTEPISGSLNVNEDWFLFNVTEPSELSVNLTVSANHRPKIILYNTAKSQLMSHEVENKGEPSTIHYPVGEPGVYYLRIYDADNSVSTDPYTLDLDLLPIPDSNEPNNNYATAASLAFGTSTPGYLFPKADQDWFLVDVTEPGTLVLDLTGVPDTLKMQIKLYDQNGTDLGGTSAMHGGDSVHFQIDLELSATYRVRLIDQNSSVYATQPYTFNASFIPANDSTESNDGFSDATPLRSSNQATGIIQPIGDTDWFSFEMSEPRIIRIQIAQAEGIQPRLILYDDSKNQLAALTAHNTGDTIILTYSIPTADTYYLQIQDDGNNQTSTEPYILTIEGGAFETHSPIAETPVFTPNPAVTGETVHLLGQGTDLDGTIVGYEWTSDLDGLIGTSSSLDLPSLSTGRHRISLRVRDDEGNWSGRAVQSLIVGSELGAEIEYNNVYSNAVPIPLDQWIVGSIDPRGDNDYYKIYINSCGRINLLVDAVPTTMRPALDIYNEEGKYLYFYNTALQDGEWLSLSFYAEPGAYIVRVRDYNNQTHNGETYALNCSFDSGFDLNEPNDSFAEATPIEPNSVVSNATICLSGEYDYYSVNLTQSGRLSLELSNLPSTMKGSIELYDPDFNYLWVYNTSVNGGDSVPLTYDALTPGTVYIRVHNTLSATEPQSYELSSQFTPVSDPFEPNDGAGQAELLTNSLNHGTIFSSSDQDWFKIWLDSGETLNLSVTDVPAGMEASIHLYNADFDYLWAYEAANNPDDQVFLSYTAPADGMYLIRIKDDAGGSYVDPYLLTVTGGTLNYEPPFDPQSVETDDNSKWTLATDLALDTVLSGQITQNDDYDYFRIQVNQPGILVISHTSIPAEVTSEMWIYDASHDQVGYRRATNPSEDNILELPIVQPGTYFIKLHDYQSNNSSTDLYSLEVTLVPVVDSNEPNNTLGAATMLGSSSISGYLFDGSDNDYFKVYVRSPGELSLSLDAVPAENRLHLNLYDANGNHLSQWVNTNPGIGGDDLIAYTAPNPGFYYIRVRDEDDTYSSDPYTLRITGADFSSAPLLAMIGDRNLDATIPYAFTITATDPDNPENLVYSASNLPAGAVFDPDTRTFSWTPTREQEGTYPDVHFEVNDGTARDSETVTFNVVARNRPPVLAAIGNKQSDAGTELSFQINATDPDGDTLSFSAENLPDGAVFDLETRTFSWTSTTNQIGIHQEILFRVSDGDQTDFESINIEISEPTSPYANWLNSHFTEEEQNDLAISGPTADPDMDGATNENEFGADTNPRDQNSVLLITDLIVDVTGIEIHWKGGSSALQILERKIELGDESQDWHTLQTVNPPTSITNTFYDSNSDITNAFYRIRAERK